MALTPEKLSRASVLVLFIFLTLLITAVLYLPIKSVFISVGVALLIVSTLMVIFYSQELGIFAIVIFVIFAIATSLITLRADIGFLFGSLAVGVLVIYSFVR